MDWNAAADAFLKVWDKTGMGTYGPWGALVLTVAILIWKWLDAWGKRSK